jgi:hypothetical protein
VLIAPCGGSSELPKALAHETVAETSARITHTNLALSVISALRTLETGQFFSVSWDVRVNVASSKFGTLARRVKAE